MALKQTNKTNLVWNRRKLEKLYLNKKKIERNATHSGQKLVQMGPK